MPIRYPFSRILLATELTEFDAGAERIAFAMAQRCGVPLRVVIPMLSNPEFEADMPDLALHAEREVGKRIELFRQRAAAADVTLDIHIRRGAAPHPEIVAEAQEAHSDLIVIRRRGKPSFLAKLLVGEMVSKVVRDVSCSVLLVPRAAEFWSHGIVAAIGDTRGGTENCRHRRHHRRYLRIAADRPERRRGQWRPAQGTEHQHPRTCSRLGASEQCQRPRGGRQAGGADDRRRQGSRVPTSWSSGASDITCFPSARQGTCSTSSAQPMCRR